MKRMMAVCLSVVLLLVGSGCKETSQFTKYSAYYFDYFDTATTIIGYTESKESFDATCIEIEALLKEYHRLYTIYNRYENYTNLVTVNDVTDGVHQAVQVDKKIMDLLTFAKEMNQTTNGYVNVAMGSVLKIWHNYRNAGISDPAEAKLPPMNKLQEAAQHCSIDDLVLDVEAGTVFLKDPEMRLDVGAIAKGYAVEAIARYLMDKGVTGYLLNVGGNVRTIGMAGDKPWNVGIENPDKEDEENPYIEFLHLEGQSLVTSGSYQRYYEVDGVQYHHIIDPATLMPGTNYRSVSVLTQDSGLGDAFSTALFLMSYEEGAALVAKTEGVEAMWVMPDGEQRYSDGFKAYTYVPETN